MLVFCYVVWDASATTVGCVIEEDKGFPMHHTTLIS